MKVGFAQLNPRMGDIAHNIKNIQEFVTEASLKGLRLIVFPELSITGYPLRDLLYYRSLVEENLAALNSLIPLSKKIAILCGYVDFNKNSTGKPYQNCCAYIEGGKILGRYQKQLLPYYGIFEEERFFEPGIAPGVFLLDGKKIGVTICEDIWNVGDHLKEAYHSNPLLNYTNLDLDLLVNLSASPFQLGKPETRLSLAKKVTSLLKAPLILCNQVGANDELIFDGSSFAMTPNGNVAASLPPFERGMAVFDTDLLLSKPPQKVLEPLEWIKKALVLGIRDYVHKCGAKKVCLGLSGGIDSALAAMLAVEALGKEHVLALSMPSRFSSPESQRDALFIASHLGIDCKTVSIDTLYQNFKALLPQGLKSITLENLQPRIRMILLMALSNETGALLLNTSNKSEISTGFATLYGDSAGALGVLGDLKKKEIYSLARFLNSGTPVIPETVFSRAPSAELKENQKDEDVLPPYETLDPLIALGIEEFKSSKEILSLGYLSQDLEKFKKLYHGSEYKRRQFPPILRVSERAYGMGRRMPLAAKNPL